MLDAAILQAYNVTHGVVDENQEYEIDWCDTSITAQSVDRAIAIMDYFISQKFALMPPEKKTLPLEPELNDENADPLDALRPVKHNLKSLLTNGQDELPASYVAGRHLMPPMSTPGSTNKYKTESAAVFLEQVSRAGFGTMHRKGRSVLFRKRAFSELQPEARNLLAEFNIDDQQYSKKVRLQSSSQTPCSSQE